MKFCKYCGKQLDDNAKFCKECGALSGSAVNAAAVVTAPQPIEPERTAVSAGQDAPVAAAVVPAPQPIEPERTAVTSEPDAPVSAKKKKGKVICILIAVAVIIGAVFAGVTIYNWYNSNEQKFIRAIDAGEYEEAFELVKTDETLKDNEALAEKLLNRIDAVKNDYCEETIAYSDALLDLDAIQRMGISEILDKIADTRRYLAQLNQSRICFSSAETFFKEGNFEDAMDLYAQVVEEDGNYEAARKQYSESVNRYREQMLNKAAEYAKNDEYSSAIEILDTALIHLPDDHAITEQRLLYENAEKEVFKAKLLENAAAYASEGRYLSAINLLDTYYNSVDAEDTDINLLRQEYCDQYAESVLSEAQKEVDNNAYQSAIDMVNSALAVTGKNELLSNAVKQYKNMYVEYAIKKAAAYLEEKDYSKALMTVQAALKDMPGNEKLLNEEERINNLIPKNLLDVCTAYESSYYTECKNGVRSFYMSGESYTNGFTIKYSGYAYFNLNGNYNILEFDCGHVDGSDMYGKTITIFLDGIACKTIELSANELPQHFSIEVTGVKQLRFQLGDWRSGEVYGFANVTVQ